MKKLISFGMAALIFLITALTAFAANVPMNLSFRFEMDGVDLTGQNLQPEREYRFPVLVRYEDEVPSHLREEEMEGKRFTVSLRQGGDAVYTPTLEADGGRYYLVVKTKPYYGTRAAQAEFLIRLQDKSSGKKIAENTVQLAVGSSRMEDEDMGTVGEGEAFRVDNNFPIITKKQFQRLAKENNYRAVTLEGDGWEYTVNVTDLPDLNLYSTSAVSQDVLQKYPNQEFYFLTFPASPNFGITGTMVLDVEHLTEFDGEFYLYRRLGNRLYYLKTQYDEEERTLTFRPAQLGSYLITDRKLGDVELTGAGAGTTAGSSAGTAVIDSPNPDTGSRQATGPAALLALAALVTGAVVTFKKG